MDRKYRKDLIELKTKPKEQINGKIQTQEYIKMLIVDTVIEEQHKILCAN